jgi:DNA-directed RNA polymerase specialized sigma24 family protein
VQPICTAQGWTLRQIGAELGLTETTVSDQLRRAGATMRRGVPPHPARHNRSWSFATEA